VTKFPNASILQSWQWGWNKSQYGWRPDYLIWKDGGEIRAAALALIREQKIPLLNITSRIIYIPHGPLFDWNDSELLARVLDDIEYYSKIMGADYIKIDPQISVSIGLEEDPDYWENPQAKLIVQHLERNGWNYSRQQIQFRNTFLLDLDSSEDILLSRMKQKTRYNIRLAQRKGVNVQKLNVKELTKLYELYAITSSRDGFVIRPKDYYLNLWKNFMEEKMATALVAEVDKEIVGGIILFHFHEKSYYFYGMSSENHREKMPNYLLQWEAIRISKKLGYRWYDLWGAPNILDKTDPMWGVYKFKDGFGGRVVKTVGAYDYPTSAFKYKIIQNTLPVFLAVTRLFRKKQIRQEIDS